MTSGKSMKVVYELPEQCTAPADGVQFWSTIRFEYGIRDHGWCRRAIRFKGVEARREREEACVNTWHYGASDKLVEINDSDWLKEICADARPHLRREFEKKHHYMIYLRDAPVVELIADSWELLPEELGEWPLIKLT